MQDRGPNPKETIEIIDRLVALGLIDESRFRAMHHLGGSITGFRRYCDKKASFIIGGNNHKLHEKLKEMLDAHEGSRK
jgi:hypothetical protein